jgi:hypothetical protein
MKAGRPRTATYKDKCDEKFWCGKCENKVVFNPNSKTKLCDGPINAVALAAATTPSGRAKTQNKPTNPTRTVYQVFQHPELFEWHQGVIRKRIARANSPSSFLSAESRAGTNESREGNLTYSRYVHLTFLADGKPLMH